MRTSGSIIAAMALLPVCALAASPFDGTWKTDTSKIHHSKKPYVYVVDSSSFTCSSCTPPFTVKTDGTEQKFKGHDFDTASVTETPNSVTLTTKLNGKPFSSVKFTVSADGKTAEVENDSYYGTAPVLYKDTLTRAQPGAAGAHPLSGSWIETKIESISDSGSTQTLGMTDDGFTFSANGQSYDAKFDGKKYPMNGDPTNMMVKVKKVSPTEVMEYDYDKGKLVEIDTMTVTADGKTLHVIASHPQSGRVSHITMEKLP